MVRFRLGALLACSGFFVGCGGSGGDGKFDSTSAETSTAGDTQGETGQKFDVQDGETNGGEGGDPCKGPGGDAELNGTVYAPNGELPISGALIYVTDSPPDAIPQTVYCEECVELECMTDYAETDPDGSFSFSTVPGHYYLVVQKGQFRRVTEIDLEAGDNDLSVDLTTLPGDNDPGAGLNIPRIALVYGQHDRLENALGKLGLGDTDIEGYDESLVWGSEPFDLWDNHPDQDPPGSKGTVDQLLLNYPLMEQYHIIFLPCSLQAGEYPTVLDDPTAIENIRKWVAAGGKWYVADWSNEAIREPFGQYQTFYKRADSTTVDQWQGDQSTDLGRYDPLGTVLDDDLLAWLEALPPEIADINPVNDPNEDVLPTLGQLPMVQTMYVYSGVKEVHDVFVDDGMGGKVNVGHKVWIEGEGSETWGVPPADEQHPLTITAEYGCGRLMFTAYHTVEGRDYVGLTPQELVLMYLIMEIGICQTPYDPPPPEG
jgi:hypothetical protein